MPCYRPLSAFQTSAGAVVFAELKRNDIVRSLDLPCGQCVGCRLERSRQWAVRCMHEAQLHEENSFVTLTYSDEHLPEDRSLNHRHFQLFIKRLRKALGNGRGAGDTATTDAPEARRHGAPPHTPVRYYMCGEYGEDFDRPHYHACLFGIDFPDKLLFSEQRGNKLYTSATLTKLWGMGHATIGAITFESAAYTARYVMKKVTGQKTTHHYKQTNTQTGEITNRKPEYAKMSLKPGIGANWIKKFERDVYPQGTVIVRGHETKSPKYYDKLHKRRNRDEWDELQWIREREGLARSEHNTNERLAAREKVANAKANQLKREIK